MTKATKNEREHVLEVWQAFRKAFAGLSTVADDPARSDNPGRAIGNAILHWVRDPHFTAEQLADLVYGGAWRVRHEARREGGFDPQALCVPTVLFRPLAWEEQSDGHRGDLEDMPEDEGWHNCVMGMIERGHAERARIDADAATRSASGWQPKPGERAMSRTDEWRRRVKMACERDGGMPVFLAAARSADQRPCDDRAEFACPVCGKVCWAWPWQMACLECGVKGKEGTEAQGHKGTEQEDGK